MKLAIVAADFTPSEANQLRRAMATFRNLGTINAFRDKLVTGMVTRGYEEAFAARCFKQIEGFGSYGFPESHAIAFARLVWVSAWIKHHEPAIFAAALLNSQPMGFYAPAQIVRDARDRGIGVVLITHNPHHAYLVGDEFVLLTRGRMTHRWLKEEVELDDLIAAMAGGAELADLAHELGE